MLEDSLRRRLEALNRGPLPISPHRLGGAASDFGELASTELSVEDSRVSAGIGFHATAGSHLDLKPRPHSDPVATATSPTCRPLPGLLRCGDVVDTAAGPHLRIRLPLDAVWPDGERLAGARQEHLQRLLTGARYSAESAPVIEGESAALVAALPDRFFAVDLETCGLAGAALFLIGLLRQIDGKLAVELLLARDYTEEAAVLHSFWQIVACHDVFLTFNGKSFDWPMVRERSVRHRLKTSDPVRPLQHLDVLHHARRRWRRQLPDCRLQTLERFICRRHRTGDIPGHRIPAVYADFVRTGIERDMDAVLYHNALDLVTLFDLALRLAT